MLKKVYSETGDACQVTFELPEQVEAQTACLCGEFNDWNTADHPMTLREDGSFTITLSLQPGRQYRFRYLLDGTRWENDWAADSYIPNPIGSEDSALQV